MRAGGAEGLDFGPARTDRTCAHRAFAAEAHAADRAVPDGFRQRSREQLLTDEGPQLRIAELGGRHRELQLKFHEGFDAARFGLLQR